MDRETERRERARERVRGRVEGGHGEGSNYAALPNMLRDLI